MKLASDNKFGKYARYAIGEIVLVVIGILIAIQLNTWKKEVQSQKMEKTYLANLKNDLIIQQEINQEQLDYELLKMEQVDSALLFLENKLELEPFLRLLQSLAARHTLVSNMVSFEMMLETGNANNIRNAKILDALIRYKQLVDYVTLVVNNNNIHLIDAQFGGFASRNELGISYDKEGEIRLSTELNGEKRYLLYTKLIKRKGFSIANRQIVVRLNEATSKLIQEIKAYLEEE